MSVTERVLLLKKCIATLESEIQNIESGNADNMLQYYGSYAVPEEFVEICSGIKFPPPIFSSQTSESWKQKNPSGANSSKLNCYNHKDAKIESDNSQSTSTSNKLKVDRLSEPLSSVLGESPFAQSVINSFSNQKSSVDVSAPSLFPSNLKPTLDGIIINSNGNSNINNLTTDSKTTEDSRTVSVNNDARKIKSMPSSGRGVEIDGKIESKTKTSSSSTTSSLALALSSTIPSTSSISTTFTPMSSVSKDSPMKSSANEILSTSITLSSENNAIKQSSKDLTRKKSSDMDDSQEYNHSNPNQTKEVFIEQNDNKIEDEDPDTDDSKGKGRRRKVESIKNISSPSRMESLTDDEASFRRTTRNNVRAQNLTVQTDLPENLVSTRSQGKRKSSQSDLDLKRSPRFNKDLS